MRTLLLAIHVTTIHYTTAAAAADRESVTMFTVQLLTCGHRYKTVDANIIITARLKTPHANNKIVKNLHCLSKKQFSGFVL